MTKNVSYWKGKFISNKFNSVIYFFYLLGIIFFHKPEKLKSWDPMFLLDRAPLEPGRLAPPLKINVNQTMSFSVMSILTHIRQLVKVDCPKRRGGIILQSHYFSHALSPRFWIAMAAQKIAWGNCSDLTRRQGFHLLGHREKLASVDMLNLDTAAGRTHPPKVFSRGQDHPPNHLTTVFIHHLIFHNN